MGPVGEDSDACPYETGIGSDSTRRQQARHPHAALNGCSGLVDLLAKLRSNIRRSKWTARKRNSGPLPEGPLTRNPNSLLLTASSGMGSLVRRQVGSIRLLAGLGRTLISGAASIRRVSAPLRGETSAAHRPARLAPTTKTSTSRSSVFTGVLLTVFCCEFYSGGTRTRTGDTMIFSNMSRSLGMQQIRIAKRISVRRVSLDVAWCHPYKLKAKCARSGTSLRSSSFSLVLYNTR